MDYEMILPVVAGCSGVFAGCAVLYSKIRPIFPVKVNCWFCNTDTKVKYRHREGWVCPSCEQYNGFTEDGDYNRDLPAQYCDNLNSPVGCHKPKQATSQPSLALGNGFCQTCNLNQTLKVRALADYTPINPNNYDQEIEAYKKRLERTYALCRQCEATLHQTLGKQDSWLKPKLISWRLILSSQNKAQIYADAKKDADKQIPIFLRLLHLIGILISIMLLLCNLHHLQQHSGTKLMSLDFGVEAEVYLTAMYKFSSAFIITGLSLVLIVIFSSGKDMLLVSDAIASFIWVGLLALTSSRQLIVPKDYNSLQVMMSCAAVLFTLWTSVVPRSSTSTRTITKPQLNKSRTSEASSGRLEDSHCTLNASLSDELNNLTPPPCRPSDVTSTPLPCPSNISAISHHHKPQEMPPLPPLMVPQSHAPASTLDDTLGSLKISSPVKHSQRISPSSTFSPRNLFSDKSGYNSRLNDSYSSQRVPPSPTRMSTKNITQSSWVAGGYWGHPVSPARDFAHTGPNFGMMNPGTTPMFPLSRSSSQSSGFVSHNSGLPPYPQACSLPNSQPGSLCGDDRASVLSEPVYKSWGPGYPSSVYASDSASQYSFRRQHGPPKSDAQSLYSCASALSDQLRLRGQSSPTGSSSYLFQDALGTHSENSSNGSSQNTTKVCQADTTMSERTNREGKEPILNYRNPWIAFILGMSIAANGFLAILLFVRADSHNSILS